MSLKRTGTRYKKFSDRPLQRRVFEAITGQRLVYNTCWEDPCIDRKLLEIRPDSRIVMITSAGENALDYLLDDPASISCIDINPAQNALLELKRALYRNGDHQLLWTFFGKGGSREAPRLYRRQIRPHLGEQAAAYWDRQIDYFGTGTPQGSFYFRGTTGWFAWFFHRRFRRKGIHGDILRLLDASSLEEQVRLYDRIEPQLWSPLHRWLMRRKSATALLGIPEIQRNMAGDRKEDLPAFVRRAMRHVFTRLPVEENYFWRVYLTGSYTRACSPNYLKSRFFETIRERTGRISQQTVPLSVHLAEHFGSYTHFVLLDHMDWLAGKPEEVDTLWRRILDSAEPGARILFRSASSDPPFLPQWIQGRVEFLPTGHLHRLDRVGTYGSTRLGVVLS